MTDALALAALAAALGVEFAALGVAAYVIFNGAPFA